MKKLIALILSMLLLAGCAPAVYDGPTESAWVLTEQATTFYNTVTGETQSHIRTYSYDGMGNEVRSCYYTDGEPTSEYRYTYDDRGNRIREVSWNHFWFFTYPSSRTARTYDEQNRLLTTTYRNGFGIKTGQDIYIYDDEANTVHWDGTYDTQTKYLNENGDPIRVVTFSEPAGMEIETLYKYDALGRNTKITEYYDGALAMTTQRRCDELDRPLEYTIYDADGSIVNRTTWLYEENTVTSFDSEGNRTIETLGPDGQVTLAESYDKDGNLTSRSVYTYTEIQIPAKEE